MQPTITIISSEFPPFSNGGVGTTAEILFKRWYGNTHFEINIITLRYGKKLSLPAVEKSGNITIYRIRIPYLLGKIYKPWLCFPLFAGIFSIFNRQLIKNSDVLHALNLRDIAFFRKYNKPLIINICDFYSSLVPFNPLKYPFDEKGKFVKYLQHIIFKVLNKLSIKKADAILCTSNFSRKMTEMHNKSAIGKVYIVHKGSEIPNSKKKLKKDISVIFVGSRFATKGAKEVISAIKLLVPKYKNIKCVMIGRYSKIDYDYERLIKNLELENNITILGHLGHNELDTYLLRSRIYVIPTYMEAGVAQSAVEAMAAKLPIVSSNIDVMLEAITKENGFVMGPSDYHSLAKHIDFLLSHPNIARKMGKNAYKLAIKDFSVDSMLKGYISIYNKFLPINKKIPF